jgi:hypothetical protein
MTGLLQPVRSLLCRLQPVGATLELRSTTYGANPGFGANERPELSDNEIREHLRPETACE